MSSSISIIQRSPSVEEYAELRQLVGWPGYGAEVIRVALENTLFSVVALDHQNQIIGMGRIVGDNAIYLHVQDLIVKPSLQKHGVGKSIMKELLKYIDKTATTNTNIGLMCSKGREDFYKSFGFIERPNDTYGSGMIKIK